MVLYVCCKTKQARRLKLVLEGHASRDKSIAAVRRAHPHSDRCDDETQMTGFAVSMGTDIYSALVEYARDAVGAAEGDDALVVDNVEVPWTELPHLGPDFIDFETLMLFGTIYQGDRSEGAGSTSKLPPGVVVAIKHLLAQVSDDRLSTGKSARADPLKPPTSPTSLPLLSDLILEFPQRWQRYHELILLPPTAFTESVSWQQLFAIASGDAKDELYEGVARGFGVSHIAKRAPISKDDPVRRPCITPLYGLQWTQQQTVTGPYSLDFAKAFWTYTMQYGIYYVWAPQYTMFSLGNIQQKTRVANMVESRGEVIVDLYAGIGYWVFPWLIGARCKQVYACEWNEWSVEGLRRSADMNGITHKVMPAEDSMSGHATDVSDDVQLAIIPGDNRNALRYIRGCADRVSLGLLPSARQGIPLAIAALRSDRGGVLHIHENVSDGDNGETLSAIVGAVQQACHELGDGRQWQVAIIGTHRVKSFAPRITHWVFDIQCRPVI